MTHLILAAAKTHHVQQASTTGVTVGTVTISIGLLALVVAFFMWRNGNATISALVVGALVGVMVPTVGGFVVTAVTTVIHALVSAGNGATG
jgi:hypothetical protein